MRFLGFTIFILIINLSMGLVSNLNYLEVNKVYSVEWFDKINNETMGLENEGQFSGESGSFVGGLTGLADFIQLIWGIGKLLGVMFLGVIWIPQNLASFGVPAMISVYISIIYYLIFLVGIIQFVSNRGTEGMQ